VQDKAGVLARRKREARAATTRPTETADLDRSFERQEEALAGAEGGFAQPPAADVAATPPQAATPAGPATGSGDAAAAEPERRTKQRIRSNQKEAFDLGE
jgi:hypothetical protein